MMKKFLPLLLSLCFLFFCVPAEPVHGLTEPSNLTGQGIILIDAATGDVLYERDSHRELYPASTTKILTGILVLENLDLDARAEIDEEASFTGGSRIFLLEGEDITVREVLYAMFLESANDAAVCLAKMVSGTVEEFAELMNARAAELGALNSNFVNPNGLHDDNHYSSAYDLALFARYAMENPTFRDYVSTYQHTIPATNLQDTRYLYNTNRLLYDEKHTVTVNGETRPCKYEGVTGIKTGFTSKSGNCLVAGAEREGTELIAVTLNANSSERGHYADCITLLDWGFENYRTLQVASAGDVMGAVAVKKGEIEEVSVKISEDIMATVPKDAPDALIKTEVSLPELLEAPFERGLNVGQLTVYVGAETLGTYDLTTVAGTEATGFLSHFKTEDGQKVSAGMVIRKILKIILYAFLIFVALVAIYVLYKRHQIKKKKLLRQQRRERDRLERERLARERLARDSLEWQRAARDTGPLDDDDFRNQPGRL